MQRKGGKDDRFRTTRGTWTANEIVFDAEMERSPLEVLPCKRNLRRGPFQKRGDLG